MKSSLILLMFSVFIFSNCQSQTNKTTSDKEINSKTDTTIKTKDMKDYREIIVDVRTEEEFEYDGHAPCAVNYPLDQISSKVEDLKKYERVVVVCRSGARAGVAKNILESKGIKNIENRGPWQNAPCAN